MSRAYRRLGIKFQMLFPSGMARVDAYKFRFRVSALTAKASQARSV